MPCGFHLSHTLCLFSFTQILRVGEEESKQMGGQNPMATYVAEAEGLTKIEELQQHANNDLYEKAVRILETYFGVEDEEEMAQVAPSMEGDHFSFGMDSQQQTFDFSGGNAM
jgi:hypothetical protein